MIVYDIFMIDGEDRYLVATIVDENLCKFVFDLMCKAYEFKFELVERTIIENGNS